MRRGEALPGAALLGALLCFGLWHATQSSATFDEPVTLLGGLSQLHPAAPATANIEHPPLAKLWLALPLRALGAKLRAEDQAWSEVGHFGPGRWQAQYDLAHRLLYLWNAPRADTLLLAARIAALLLALLLGGLIFFEARRIGGPSGGLLALTGYALSPMIIAHGSLATLDLPLSLGCFATMLAGAGLTRSPTPLRAAALALALGATLLVKVSAWVLPPLLLLLLIGVEAGQRRRALLMLVLSFAGALFVVHLGYGLSGGLGTIAPGAPLPAQLLSPLLPADYAAGLSWQLQHGTSGHGLSYLRGELSPEGFASYYPLALLMKTTPAEWLLLGAGLPLAFSASMRREALPWLLLGLGYFLFIAASSRVQIGVRYLLPALPALLCVAGASLGRTLEKLRPTLWLPALVLLLQLLAAFRSAGDPLAYFNPVFGGAGQGYTQLSDSNVDWGQGLRELARWHSDAGSPPLALSYFGSADPTHAGLRFVALRSPGFQSWYRALPAGGARGCGPGAVPPGHFAAVSVTNLHGQYLRPPHCHHGFLLREPVARIGGSILVYGPK